MDALLVLAYLIAGLLLLILVAVTLLYAVPVRSALQISVAKKEFSSRLVISWLFLGVGIRNDSNGTRAELLAGHHVLFTILPGPAPAPETVPEKKDGGTVIHPDPGLIFRLMRRLVPPLESIRSVIWNESRFDSMKGRLTLGLGDPVLTGTCYGYYWAGRFILETMRIQIDIEPVFDREVFEGNVEIRMSLRHPLILLLAAVRLVLHPAVREIAAEFRQETTGAAA